MGHMEGIDSKSPPLGTTKGIGGKAPTFGTTVGIGGSITFGIRGYCSRHRGQRGGVRYHMDLWHDAHHGNRRYDEHQWKGGHEHDRQLRHDRKARDVNRSDGGRP
jgi:hypothetical protein